MDQTQSTYEPDELELMALTLLQGRLAKQDSVFLFTGGALRGKLVSAELLKCLPSSTYRSMYDAETEYCVQMWYIPGPRQGTSGVSSPTDIKFTRKPVLFNIPVRLINTALFLQKLEDKVWMLNINTSVKK